MRTLILCLGCVGVLACGTPPTEVGSDAGPKDSGVTDSGTVDSGLPDAGLDCNAGVTPTADVVLTERGPVRGEVTTAGRAFRGIPYVKPPLGALRWKPPETDLSCWSGVREAKAWAPVCPQIEQQQGVPFDAGAPINGNEDCLVANVFTPPGADAGLPVMVFIHGGGNTNGSTAEVTATNVRLYDGTVLAQRAGAVVVTMQYRLGALGFLSTTSLDAESDAGVSGNYGLLDQQAALKWVKRNVSSFGGDPTRVMIFGESAGAVDTCMQVGMPGSAGLFHRALMESGSCGAALPVATRRSEGTTWLAGTGCASAADVPSCLRALTPEQLIRAYPVPVVVGGKRPEVSWGPTVDGVVIPLNPLDAIKTGKHNKVPFAVGSNTEETNLTTPIITTDAEYKAVVSGLVGPALADTVVGLYPSSTYGSPRKALVQVTSDAFFTCQARLAARAAFAGQPGTPVYRYLFARAPVPARGVFHGLELAYVFQKISELTPTVPVADAQVEASVLGFWSRFAATGNPNSTTVEWPAYATGDTMVRLDSPNSSISGWRKTECDFWDSFIGASVPAP